jgi:two-component system, NtrC family, response regulator AtoC
MPIAMKILVADDEKIKRVTLAHDLQSQGHDVVTAGDGEEALEKISAAPFDVIVTDLKMPKLDGIELLKRIKRDHLSDAEVIIMTAYGSIPLAVEAGKLGAFDFLTKPFRNEDVFPLLARIEAHRQGTTRSSPEPLETLIDNIDHAVVGQSPAMRRVRRLIEICTRSDANVLICGETGCGKDLAAATIHRNSPRRSRPFVKVGCELFPSQLIESELYGHEKGAFTGAEQRRQGRFELAESGTLYLDDADDIPLEHQAKLLRAIEEKVFERVGGDTPLKADVRIVASTKQNLLEKIAAGNFRQDLYYRLDVMHVNIPPLRERREDIPLLADCLLKRIAKERAVPLEPEALEVLQRHDWPGNVRELCHVLERVYLVGSGRISKKLLLAELEEAAQKRPTPTGLFHETIGKTERELLEAALQSAGGNKSSAAAALGMKLSTFRDKLVKHGLI